MTVFDFVPVEEQFEATVANDDFNVSTKEEKRFSKAVSLYEKKGLWVTDTLSHLHVSRIGENKEDGFEITAGPQRAESYELSDAAYSDLLKLLGADCKSVRKVPVKDELRFVNSCAEIYPEKVIKYFLSGGKVRAVHSEGYAILPVDEVMEATSESAKNRFHATFNRGYLGHDYAISEWGFESPEVERILAKALEKTPTEPAKAYICAATSHTSKNAATVRHHVTFNGYRLPFGNAKKLLHKGAASMDMFKDNLNATYASLTAGAEQMARLQNVSVTYPEDCLVNVMKAQAFNLADISQALLNLEGELRDKAQVTALDLYMQICRATPYWGGNAKEAYKTEEKIAGCLTRNWSLYDHLRKAKR